MRPWFLKQYFKGHHHLVGNNENLRDCLDPAEGRSPGRGCQAANQVWRQLMELLSVRWSYHPSIHCMDEEAVLLSNVWRKIGVIIHLLHG